MGGWRRWTSWRTASGCRGDSCAAPAPSGDFGTRESLRVDSDGAFGNDSADVLGRGDQHIFLGGEVVAGPMARSEHRGDRGQDHDRRS